jgi:hypothetical protein
VELYVADKQCNHFNVKKPKNTVVKPALMICFAEANKTALICCGGPREGEASDNQYWDTVVAH